MQDRCKLGEEGWRIAFSEVLKTEVAAAVEENQGSRENNVSGKTSCYFFCRPIFEKRNVLLSQVCCTPETAVLCAYGILTYNKKGILTYNKKVSIMSPSFKASCCLS